MFIQVRRLPNRTGLIAIFWCQVKDGLVFFSSFALLKKKFEACKTFFLILIVSKKLFILFQVCVVEDVFYVQMCVPNRQLPLLTEGGILRSIHVYNVYNVNITEEQFCTAIITVLKNYSNTPCPVRTKIKL